MSYSLALWLPLVFSTPLIIAIQNPDDFPVSFFSLLSSLALLTFIVILISQIIIKWLTFIKRDTINSSMVSLATVITIQGYIVHGFFNYGQLDGKKIEWQQFGWLFWFESVGFVLSIVVLTKLYLKINQKTFKNNFYWIGSFFFATTNSGFAKLSIKETSKQ